MKSSMICLLCYNYQEEKALSIPSWHVTANQQHPSVSHQMHLWHRLPLGAGCPPLCCRESLCFQGCPASSWDRILWALKVSLLSWQEHRQATSPYSGAFPWTRKSNLDYLALDFNSASPSPVQKVWVPAKNPKPPHSVSTGRKTRSRACQVP